MNATKGFIRLWIVLSTCWISFFGYNSFSKLALSKNGFFDPNKFIAEDPHPYSLLPDWNGFISFSELVLFPPIFFLLIGAIMTWVINGFRHQR
jgi:hypothetical protein